MEYGASMDARGIRVTLRSGSVHGRFQPFHLGHLEYVLAAAHQCDFLWVGITQPEISNLQSGGAQPAHRYEPSDNPFTYWERVLMVSASLAEAGVDEGIYRIVPFPIERPESLLDYVPMEAVAYTTVYETWNEQKIQLLNGIGYRVEVLWQRDTKEVAGGTVRQLLRSGDERWRGLVPAATARIIDGLDLDARPGALSAPE
jgi:cytidyltransferase-like protein